MAVDVGVGVGVGCNGWWQWQWQWVSVFQWLGISNGGWWFGFSDNGGGLWWP